MTFQRLRFAACLIVCLAVSLVVKVSGKDLPPDSSQLEFFEKKIRPILVSNCYSCHSAETDKIKGGLQLDTREGIREGGDSGHAVVPRDIEESLLIRAIRYTDKNLQMPPAKDGGKLPDDVIKDFETWVQMGAPDPRDGGTKPIQTEIDWNKARSFWSFQKPKAPPIPSPKQSEWSRSDIDRFVLKALESKRLSPVQDAERQVLLRRVFFDLIGLQPSPEEIAAFEKDTSPKAFERVVDRLLASPRFGERWGRHWLDVARYAESSGKERNFTFPEAWRYRDYVIAAFNADKPYNEFVQEQVAGDLLPAKTAAERNEHLVATGFLAIGPKSLNERKREQFLMDQVDEQIDVTSRAVLGLTISCARCHDHKFDPITTRDYHAMAGIFRSTETLYGTEPSQQNRQPSELLSLTSVGTSRNSSVAPSQSASIKTTISETSKVSMEKNGEGAAKRRKRNREAISVEKAPVHDIAPSSEVERQYVMGVREGRPKNVPIYIRGELSNIGEIVPRGLVTILAQTNQARIPQRESGRRQLAEWLGSADNPLTARVMVNRVWQHLFGQGLVRTPDNFGFTGELPSHPELLDYLSMQFVEQGWSVKSLIRTIVLSRTYQLSSAHNQACYAQDPENVLLWRATPRRLHAESIRDAMLMASGTLDVTPPQGSPVSQLGDAPIARGIRQKGFSFESNHRSVYLPIIRGFVPETLALFDFAEPSLVVPVREVTSVPSQSLFMMNSPFVTSQAEAMARRLLSTGQRNVESAVRAAYLRCFSRPPTPKEISKAQGYILDQQDRLRSEGLEPRRAAQGAWASFCQALFASAEFRYLY